MKAAVITFPGSNCDDDLAYALETVCGFKVSRLWHKDITNLSPFDLVGIPGGFSFGDYLRCGAVASLSPIMDSLKEFADQGGLVIGICNGFQILCEAGLLPGALVTNEGTKFVCRDVYLRTETTDSPWTNQISKNEVLRIPIAHGDGRYVVGEQDYLEMNQNGQILFLYTDASGEHNQDANPNGSSFGIAGITNKHHNVFGLMPHPERASDLRSKDGMKIWNSVKKVLDK